MAAQASAPDAAARKKAKDAGLGAGNLEYRRFDSHLLLLACANIAVFLAALAFSGANAAGGAAAAGGASIMLYAAFVRARRRETMRLASEIDEMLHAGHRVDFSDCREGDLAVLRNEVSKMTARLHRSAAQLEHEKGALGDALADMSHQIRTPLTAIQLMVPVIERTRDGTARTRKLHDLEGMIDRVSWLVTALLKIARFDAGAMRMQKATVDAADVIRSALKPFEIALEVREVACVVEVSEHVTFEGDAMWAAEAVSNIIKNCMEHTPAGGTITVSVLEDAIAARIRVSDTGPGIPKADLPYIFERFYCGAPRTANASIEEAPGSLPPLQGFGIGLSLAKSCVSAQGGTLRARNLSQGGACFEMTFPKITF